MLFLCIVAHAAYSLIVIFILFGLIERLGFCAVSVSRWFRARECRDEPDPAKALPVPAPSVCVQLPMFNERAVATRSIAAACSLRWPHEAFEVQVLDDSTEPDVVAMVDAAAASWRARGVRCEVIRRAWRGGYKAGALEHGRKQTSAEFLALFDADFVPNDDFLLRTVPSFFGADGEPLEDLALVQGQWAHLNALDSLLTLSQSLSLDDHHSSQMVWRSAMIGFVNFTGTAGVWRAAAIERAGGWRAASLVEDCELSFRVLFAGYRTAFVEVPVPAELPASLAAYKAQQRRWTFGWAQLIRLHGAQLLFSYRCPVLKKVHLCYHMCLSVQWPLWMAWQLAVPWLAWYKLFFFKTDEPGLVYMAPILLHMTVSTLVACVALGRGYTTQLRQRTSAGAPVLVPLLLLRVVPAAIVAAGMLPHQCYAWVEGLLTTTEAEFETTPKSGAGGAPEPPTGDPNDHPTDGAKCAISGDAACHPYNGGAAAAGLAAQREARPRAQWQAERRPATAAGRFARVPWSAVTEAAFVAYHLGWCAAFATAGWAGDAWRVVFPAAAVVCLWPTGHTAQQLADGCMRTGHLARVSALPASGGPTLAMYAEPLLGEKSRRDDQTGSSQAGGPTSVSQTTPVVVVT